MNRRRWTLTLLVAMVATGSTVMALGASSVLINEIAWGGTAAGSQDEWIELYNATESAVDLSGWELRIGETRIPLSEAVDGTLEVRQVVIPADGYFLLERTDDESVSSIDADLLYKGNLANAGVDIQLINAAGEIVDQVLCADSGWPGGSGGDGDVPYASMERQDPYADVGIWVTWGGVDACGLDASGAPLRGTPGGVNAATIAYRCAPRVLLLAPETGTVTRQVLIEWSASDPDGDAAALRVRIEVSVRDGEWSLVAETVANGGSYLWDATALAGENDVRLRVTASDMSGLAGGTTSEPFAIQASP